MKDTPLADLSKSQLQTVWNVVRAVEHSVSTYGKMLSNAKYAQTGTWAEAIRNDVSERRPIRKRTTRLTLDLETPYTFSLIMAMLERRFIGCCGMRRINSS